MNYNDGKWHGWDGGECPVHPETVVECLLECGHSGEMPAGWWTVWKTEVAAFRVIKEHKEPRNVYLKELTQYKLSTLGTSSVLVYCDKNDPCAVMFREVIE